MAHYLRPLLQPRSVALVGASDQAGSLGRTVFENILGGNFKGDVYPVNPNHRKVMGHRAYASLAAIGKPIDLAVIAAPQAAVPGILAELEAPLGAAVLMSAPDIGDNALARTWRRDVAAAARRRGVRLVGPGAFGVIRTDIGLNATYCAPTALPGRLALVSQSGAVCTAMLDFAKPLAMGFSSVISLGGGVDVGFGELLDALLLDDATDGILLYVESVGDARAFMSALRAAARTKPVVVLKAGRSQERAREDADGVSAPLPDVVFDAALRRAGTVRVRNYTQLFAAARILATGRIPQGDRLAIVANGRGPGMLAADSAVVRGVTLSKMAASTVTALATLLPKDTEVANPVNVRGDATPERLAAAVAITLADPNVDAVLALHVPRPITGPLEAARAIAAVARGSTKPVLTSWLGVVARQDVQDALEAGGIANFYTPENAVDAFSFLAAYRRNQEWLLEVPSSQPEPSPPDLEAVRRIEERAIAGGRGVLGAADTAQLLAAFGIPVAPIVSADTLSEAQAAARAIGYPVSLHLDGVGAASAPSRSGLRNAKAVARAWGELENLAPEERSRWQGGVLVQKLVTTGERGAVALAVTTDPAFGPVIVLRGSARATLGPTVGEVMLPPLNQRLARDFLAVAAPGDTRRTEPLVALLLKISALACALPWVTELTLDPTIVDDKQIGIAGARVIVDPRRRAGPGYRHLAIHPYPRQLESHFDLPDGTRLAIRPVRPEDAELERRFVAAMSEQTRFFRFFYRLHELTPAMLARFTQVDYDRELALLALVPDRAAPGGQSLVGLARFIANPDRESAEFAVVIADAWQRRGIALHLMQLLIGCARAKGFGRLEGVVLRANQGMLRFAQALGFTIKDDPGDDEQLTIVLPLE